MGSFASGLFRMLLGWMKDLWKGLWAAFHDTGAASFTQWFAKYWWVLALALCLVGAVVDLVVYLLRWRTLTVWHCFFARLGKGKQAEADGVAEAIAGKEKRKDLDRNLSGVRRNTAYTAEQWMESAMPESLPAKERYDEAAAGYAGAPERVDGGNRYNEATASDVRGTKRINADSRYNEAVAGDARVPERINMGSRCNEAATGDARVPERINVGSRYNEAAAGDARVPERINAGSQYNEAVAGYAGAPVQPFASVGMEEPKEAKEDTSFRQIGPLVRRRRFTAAELFGDGDDAEIEAPQDMIDRKEAYHETVYPRNRRRRGGEVQDEKP